MNRLLFVLYALVVIKLAVGFGTIYVVIRHTALVEALADRCGQWITQLFDVDQEDAGESAAPEESSYEHRTSDTRRRR